MSETSDMKVTPYGRQVAILDELAKEYSAGKTIKSTGIFVAI